MTTFGALADTVLQNLQGDTLDQYEQTYLTEDITVDALSFTVNEPGLVSAGLCEIGDELVWVTSVDRDTSTVTVAPFGRGYRSTTAVTHSSGDAIVNNPRFSRCRVKRSINLAITGVYPDIYGVEEYEFPFIAARHTYGVPADVDQIIRITWETVGPSRTWLPINQFRFIPDADPTNFSTGKAVDLEGPIVPGRTVRLTYSKVPTVLSAEGDVFSTVSGLPATAEEAVIYGACYRLVGYGESSRLQTDAVEAGARSELVQAGAHINAGRFYYQLYAEALGKERDRLAGLLPRIIYRTRRIL